MFPPMMRLVATLSVLLAVLPASVCAETPAAQPKIKAAPWVFVSMPDFVNVDTDFPQPGWEPALDVILTSVQRERPDFLLVAGDLLMGGVSTMASSGSTNWPDRTQFPEICF